MGNLYILHARPESWRDATLRGHRVLREVALIVTRRADSLRARLARDGIDTRLLDLDRRDWMACVEVLLDVLETGDVAWVLSGIVSWTDADVTIMGALLGQGVEVLPVPGACDLIAGLVRSGLPSTRFTFLGELPALTSTRRSLLRNVAQERHTLICSAQSANLADVLGDIEAILGDRHLAIYGEGGVWRGLISEALALRGQVLSVQVGERGRGRGNYLIIEGDTRDQTWTEERVRSSVCALLESGESARDIAREVASRSGWRRRAVYQLVVQLARS